MSEPMNVRRVAELAKIEIAPEEESRLQAEMGSIVAFARQLQTLDVAGVPPTQHIAGLVNVLREDDPQPCLAPEIILSAAPAREDVYLAVPRAVEGNA